MLRAMREQCATHVPDAMHERTDGLTDADASKTESGPHVSNAHEQEPADIVKVIRQPAMLNALKTHCKDGHPLSDDNLRIRIHRGRPQRICLTCRRVDSKDRYRARVFAAHPGAPDPSIVIDHGVPVDVWKRVVVDERGCWIWTGRANRYGYGRTTHLPAEGRRSSSTHGLMYRLLVGPIPEGLELDHLCRVPSCCNPSHLEPVTHRENMLRGQTVGAISAAKTACPRGHAYDGVSPSGYRYCRTCVKHQRRARYERDKQARA